MRRLHGRGARVRRLLATGAAAVLMASGCAGGQEAAEVDALAARIDADLDAYWEVFDPAGLVRAVLVLQDGEPVLERYTGATPDDRFNAYSVTKSVTSALIGIAIDQGHIRDVDQTLGELLPNYAPDMSPVAADITVRQLLTHTAGFPGEWNGGASFWESEDWVRTIVTDVAPTKTPDGEFRYSNAGAHLLAAILVQATGRPVLEYARTTLFDPLGIESEPAWEAPPAGPLPAASVDEFLDSYYASDFAWTIDPQGHHVGAGDLKVRPADLARIGQLYLDDGAWDGRQVISAEWVRESTTEETDTRYLSDTSGYLSDAYGYMWWVNEIDDMPATIAWGFGGQMIAVIPDLALVVVLATEFDDRDTTAANSAPQPTTAINMITNAVLPHVSTP